MKKKLLISLAAVLLIIIGCLIYVAMNINPLIARFKPDLEKIASDVMKVPVAFGELEASVFPSTKIFIKELKLGRAGEGVPFKLDSLSLNVSLTPLIFSKKLEITKLTIDAPHVVLSKNTDGVEISGLPRNKSPQVAQVEKPIQVEPPTAKSDGLAINLKAIEINDAEITLRNFIKDRDFTIKEIDLNTAVSLVGEIVEVSNLSIAASLMGRVPAAVQADRITFNKSAGDAAIPAAVIDLNGDRINVAVNYNVNSAKGSVTVGSAGLSAAKLIESFGEFIPQNVKALNVSGQIVPDIGVNADGGQFEINGKVALQSIAADLNNLKVSALNGDLAIAGNQASQNLKSSDLGLNLNGKEVAIDLDASSLASRIEVRELIVKAFGGRLRSGAVIDLASAVPSFTVQSSVSDMAISEILETLQPGSPAILTGSIDEVSADLRGQLGDTLMQSLRGTVNLILTNGAFSGFNIGGLVLKSVKDIPFISGNLYERAGDKKQLFDITETKFDTCSGNLTIGEGAITTRNFKLKNAAYDLDAEGEIGMDTSLNLDATILFTPDISQILAASIKELQRTLDSNGRLAIPLTVQGKPPAIIVVPNLKKLIEAGAKAVIKDKAGEFLDKALGGGKNGDRFKGLLDF